MGRNTKKRHLRRRAYLKTLGLAGVAGLAGCTGGDGGDGGSGDSGGGGSGGGDSGGSGSDSGSGGDGGAEPTSEPEDDFPTDDITIVIPYSPGGGYDAYARLAAKHMMDVVPVDVGVQNVSGAGGQVAAEQVATAEPDGYTAIIWNSMGFARREILQEVRYASTEMSYYGQIAEDTQGIAVSPSTGIESVEDFREAVTNGELRFGTQGILNDGVLNPLLLGLNTDWWGKEAILDNAVVYGGTSEVVNAMIGGDVEVVGANYYSLLPYEESGDVRTLLALRTFDEVPLGDQAPYAETLATAEIPGADRIEAMTTNARVFAGPPGVPENRIAYLADAFEQTLTSDAFLAEAEEIDRPIAFKGREDTQAAVTASYDLWEENEDLLQDLASSS